MSKFDCFWLVRNLSNFLLITLLAKLLAWMLFTLIAFTLNHLFVLLMFLSELLHWAFFRSGYEWFCQSGLCSLSLSKAQQSLKGSLKRILTSIALRSSSNWSIHHLCLQACPPASFLAPWLLSILIRWPAHLSSSLASLHQARFPEKDLKLIRMLLGTSNTWHKEKQQHMPCLG